MEPNPKRSRHENSGFGPNTRVFKQSNGGGHGSLECRRFNTPEGCPFGSSCKFRHVSADGRDVGTQGLPSGGNPKPCMKFFSTSGCPYGESCHLLHYVQGGLSSFGLAPAVSLSAVSTSVSQRKPVPPLGDSNAAVNGYKTKPCNRFNTAEGCRFGDKCHFAHGDSDLRLPNNQSRWNIQRGPMGGGGPPAFDNEGSAFSNSTLSRNILAGDFQGYRELNPSVVPFNDSPARYAADPIGENVHAY